MKKRKYIEEYRSNLFYYLQITFDSLASKEFFAYHYLMAAVAEGLIDLEKSIVENINEYKKHLSEKTKASEEYADSIECFNNTLKGLDEEMAEKFYNMKLIDLILSCYLSKNNQVDVAKMYFEAPYKTDEDKLEFLHSQIKAIFNGGKDYRILNSLDKVDLSPELLQEDIIYQDFMKYLIDKYLVGYGEYDKDKNSSYIINLIFRHQCKNYLVLDDEMRNKILLEYISQGWFKQLKILIKNNNLNLNTSNYYQVVDEVRNCFVKIVLAGGLSCEKYLKLHNKCEDVIALIYSQVEEQQKLVRRVED